jgi:hypothetical protein
MSDETRDPREAVLTEARAGFAAVPATHADSRIILARLDASDPVRKLLPELVEALEAIEWEINPDRMRVTGHIPDESRIWDEARTALARAREITKETTDD